MKFSEQENKYYKNIRQLLQEKRNWLVHLADETEITAKTELQNEDNKINMTVIITDEGNEYNVETLTAGLLSYADFLETIDYILTEKMTITSKAEPWLTKEVMEGLLDLEEKFFRNRITNGMQKSKSPLGRPSNKAKIEQAIELYNTGNYTGDQIQQLTGVSRSTLYRHLNNK